MSALVGSPKEEPVQAQIDFDRAVPYLPQPLVESLRAKPDRSDVWIEPLEGSFVLADIVGFTSLSEQLEHVGAEGKEVLTDALNRYYGAMLEIAQKRGGGTLKFGGDALVLSFHGKHHALAAVAAALQMQRTTATFPAVGFGQNRERIGMSIGITSGRLWAASVGAPGVRMQYLIIGDDGDQLAAVEAAAGRGEVLISPTTKRLLGDQAELKAQGDWHKVIEAEDFAATVDLREGDIGVDRLLPYLPPAIEQSIGAGQAAGAVEPEHRRVAVVFMVLSGINDILDEEGPEAALAELQSAVTSVVDLAEEYGGFIPETDISPGSLKLMAVFGAPRAQEEDAANAFRLALGFQSAPASSRVLRQTGIHRGFVFAGDLGSSLRRCYTVMGDTVNLAARLSSAAHPGEIIVSTVAASEAGASFEIGEQKAISVKGKEAPVDVVPLVRERAGLRRERASQIPLIGRDAELKTARDLADEVGSLGNARTLVITGEAGIGKTRLVRELEEHQAANGWEVVWSQAHPHQTPSPFAPWIQILEALFGLETAQSVGERTAVVAELVTTLADRPRDHADLLNGPLGIDLPEGPARELDGRARRDRLIELIISILAIKARDHPLAIVLEDVQWVDESSLDLLQQALARLEKSQIMFCVTSRTSTLHVDMPATTTVTIELEELSREDAVKFVRVSLAEERLPETTWRTLETLDYGNPLFLEEIVRSILAHGGDALELQKVEAGRSEEGEVSARLQALIMSRIDSLARPVRRILRLAAVVGSRFDRSLLELVTDIEDLSVSLSQALAELVNQDLLDAHDPSGEYFGFRNVVIQDVAYSSLPFAVRRSVHSQLASHLEQSDPDHYLSELAYHWYRAGDREKTLLYSVRAGDEAVNVFANAEALEHFRHSLDALGKVGGRTGKYKSYLWERVADCLEGAGRHGEAATEYQKALRSWRASGPARADLNFVGRFLEPNGGDMGARAALLCWKTAASYERDTDYESALRWLAGAERAMRSRQPLLAARIAVSKSVALFRQGAYDQAISWGEKGLALSRGVRDDRQLAYANDMLASSYTEQGQLAEAVGHRTDAIGLYEKLGDLRGLMVAENNLGTTYQLMGNLNSAIDHYRAALKHAEEVGNTTAAAVIHNNMGEVLLIEGRTEEAIEQLMETALTYEHWGYPQAAAGLAYVNLARAHRRLDRPDQATEDLERGMALLEEAGATGLLAEAKVRQAELAIDSGDLEKAKKLAQEAKSEAQGKAMQLVEAQALRVLAWLSLIHDELEEAERFASGAVDIARSLQADHDLGLGLLRLAESLHRAGSPSSGEQGAAHVAEAIEIFERLGAAHYSQWASELQERIQGESSEA